MKKLLSGVFLALYAFVASATTLNPIQLLNPTGSASGQAIVSTGASSAPAWGGVGVNGIAAIAANTVLANATGSSASPTAFAMPSCTGASNALGYTSGTGIICNSSINAATLGGATFAAPGAIGGTTPGTGSFTALTASGLIIPSTTNGIKGTTAADNANAGSYGEVITASVASGSAVSLTNATAANITSITLTAGDWLVRAQCATSPGGSTVQTTTACGINTTSATLPASGSVMGYSYFPFTAATGAPVIMPTTEARFNVSSSTTVYLVILSGFSASTNSAYGTITAYRPR